MAAFAPSISKQQQSDEPGTKERIKPARLRKGDTIGFTAPAGIVFDESEFEKMKNVIESMGLNIQFGEFVRERFGYFSGKDEQRAQDLNRFFKDPEINGIIAVRGGWGCSRILPYLDFEMIRQNPKIFCGFSDNTTLHLALHKYSGLVSYHGPNGTSEWTDLTKNSFKTILIDGAAATYPTSVKTETITSGTAEGPLIGGNLSILTTSLGTPYQPDMKGAILFTEDIGEPVYKIDRMLTHLKLAGILDKINGFIFGQCSDCEESTSKDSFTLNEILDYHIKPLEIPAVTGIDIGHDPGNLTFPVGIKAQLIADTGTIKLIESAVV